MAENEAQLSWDERTRQRLEAEYAQTEAQGRNPDGGKPPKQPVEQADLDDETPATPAESEDSQDDGLLSAGETEEETPDLDETPEATEAEVTDWEKRYKDTQAELTRYQMSREQDDAEYADAMSDVMRARNDLEDRYKEAEQTAAFLKQMTTANADQFRNLDWSRVPPDQVQQVQQQAQAAFLHEQRVNQALEQQRQTMEQQRQQALQREAAISRRRLTRTIPDFDNVYPKLGEYAQKRGMNVEAFRNLVDPVIMEMIYDSMQLREAPNIVETTRKTTAKAPRSKLAPEKPRGIDGRYKKADEKFHKTTDRNARLDAWEEKTALRLAREKQRR